MINKKRFLFVCKANLDRSPCAESLFKNHPNIQARSCGFYVEQGTEINQKLINWADIIFLMDSENQRLFFKKFKTDKEIIVLSVDNHFCRNDPELEKILKIKLGDYLKV